MADVTILQLPTLSPAAITGADVLPIVDVSDLTDPGGTTKQITVNGLPYNLQTRYDIRRYGAVSPGVAATNAAAILAAMTAANAAGGGIVVIPNAPFNVDGSVLTFDGMSHVLLMGESPNFNYDNAASTSYFTITTGVWGIRLPATSNYCGIQNLGLVSNGVLSATAPNPATTLGVEYGVLIETNSTLLEQVTCYGFQYGCVGASGLNSNVFDQCTFDWNTKCGFACTTGTSSAYAAYHPNLTPPPSPLASTVFTFRDCKIRRNGWGIIQRDGQINLVGTNVVEANWFGGIIHAFGSLDNNTINMQGQIYLEANWLKYDATAVYTITQNNLLKDTASTWLPWTSAVATATNDAGYQLYSMTDPTHVGGTAGPSYSNFSAPIIVCGSSGVTPGKAIYIKQGYAWKFFQGTCTGGDQPNAVRLGNATGSYLASVIHFWDWNGTLPNPLGPNANECAQFDASRTGSPGMTATQGTFKNVSGTVAGTTGTFSSTLGVTGTTSLTAVNAVAGSGGTLAGTAGWRFSDTNSGSSRDWVIADGASATGVSQIGALTFSQSTALSGDPLAAGTERMRLTASGLMVTNGFGCNGANAIAKPTVTGSKAANAALASLLTALASYGLITDSST